MTPKAHNPAFLSLVNDAKSRVREIDIDGYKKMLENGDPHVLVDVREDSEWAAGHASGAEHIGKGVIERDIEAKVPDKNATLVLYCGGGYRSALAGDALRNMGYGNVISLDGGWRAWQQAGLPAEKWRAVTSDEPLCDANGITGADGTVLHSRWRKARSVGRTLFGVVGGLELGRPGRAARKPGSSQNDWPY